MTQTVQPYAAGAMDREMNEHMADAAEERRWKGGGKAVERRDLFFVIMKYRIMIG